MAKKQHKEVDTSPRLLCMKVKTWYFVCFLLFVATFAMQIGALGAPRWTSYRSEERSYEYALRLCTEGDGDMAREGTSWYCLKKQECVGSDRSGMCILTQDMVNSFKAYWILEFFALLWVLLIMIRLLSLYRKKDHGPNWLLYLLLAAGITTHCAAIMSWFALTNASFADDCTVDMEKPYNRPNVCAEEGAKLSIATIFAFFLATALTIVVLAIDREKQTEVRFPKGKYGGMSYLIWLLLTFFLMLSGLGLVIASAAVTDWIETNDQTGSLLTYDTWEGYDDMGYECISEPICTADANQGACETFRALKRSTQAYLFFIVAVFFAWGMWADGWLMLVLRRNYAIPGVYLCLAHLTWFLELTGMVVFFGVSQSNFVTSCSNHSYTDKWDICAGDGPILAIVSTLVLFLAGVLFTYVFIGRKKVKPSELPEVEMQGVDHEPLPNVDSDRPLQEEEVPA